MQRTARRPTAGWDRGLLASRMNPLRVAIDCTHWDTHREVHWRKHPRTKRIVCLLCHPPASVLRERAIAGAQGRLAA